MRRLPITTLLASVALHAVLVTPVLVGREPRIEEDEDVPVDALPGEEDEEGELPIEELENTPFRVSLYQEPAPVATRVEPLEAAAVDAVAAPPDLPPEAAPPQPEEVPVAIPVPAPPPEPPAPPEPVAEAPAEPVEPAEPVLTDEERAALAEMERGEATADAAPADDDDGEAHELAERPKEGRSMRRARPRTQRSPRHPPCPPPVEDIARVAAAHWYIDRDLIERYATNLVELKKLGSVWTHKGPDGKLDGFKVGLARCSVLRQGGLRSGDVVHDINGRRIHSVIQAVGAYLALRAEPELQVRITRRGQPMVLSYTIEQPQRKGGKKQPTKKQQAKKQQAAR